MQMLPILCGKAVKDTPAKNQAADFSNLFFRMCSSIAGMKNIFILLYSNYSFRENQVGKPGAGKCGHTMKRRSFFHQAETLQVGSNRLTPRAFYDSFCILNWRKLPCS